MPYIQSKNRNITNKDVSGIIKQFSSPRIVSNFTYKKKNLLAEKAIAEQQDYKLYFQIYNFKQK